MALVVTLGRVPSAAAHASGIVADTCNGCHSADGTAEVSLAAAPATFNPGDTVTFTLTIKWASIRVGGTYVTAGGVGALQALTGEGLALNGQGLTHTSPKAAVGGAVTFRFGWKAPGMPGAVAFYIAALAGNGNNAPSGDAPGWGLFQWVFGCAPRTTYMDLDRDGYGSSTYGTLLGCVDGAVPVGYAAQDGDCNENDQDVHPGATEVCNGKDDNCDGQIDENAPPTMMWPDADRDGYYSFQTGTPKVGCGNIPGYALVGGDCDDTDASIHPGATEVCNGKDDNCNGSIDERVRPQCGVGGCARESPTCNPADCVPGRPTPEICNLFDDDCNGEVDDNACPTGQTCQTDHCISGGGNGGTGGSTGGSTGGGGAVGAGGTGGRGVASGGASGSISGSGGVRATGQASGSGCSVAGAAEASATGSYWTSSVLAAALLSALFFRRRLSAGRLRRR